MDDGIWPHQVKVVEGPGYVEAGGGDLLLCQVCFSEDSSQTGGHQLCQDNELTKKGGSNELEEIGMTDAGCHNHFSDEEIT